VVAERGWPSKLPSQISGALQRDEAMIGNAIMRSGRGQPIPDFGIGSIWIE
jgi:hypothetical protein